MELKLKKYGLKLDGAQVTKGRDYGQSRLKELISNAQHQGIDVPNPPSGPISYTLLIRDLVALGLITGTPSSPLISLFFSLQILMIPSLQLPLPSSLSTLLFLIIPWMILTFLPHLGLKFIPKILVRVFVMSCMGPLMV